MSFYHYNHPLKIQESIRTLIPKMGAHMGGCGFIPWHSPTHPRSMKYGSRASLLAHTFVSPCLGLKPKARVVTYVLPTLNVKSPRHEIPSHYKEFKDVIEKKNIDTLPKHRPYDYTIDLEDGTQYPFESIYNLSQDELIVLHEYINENLKKGLIWYSKSPTSWPRSYLSKRNMVIYKSVLIIVD